MVRQAIERLWARARPLLVRAALACGVAKRDKVNVRLAAAGARKRNLSVLLRLEAVERLSLYSKCEINKLRCTFRVRGACDELFQA
jgi:hypothetical protein